MKEAEVGYGYGDTMLFTAGMGLLMACLKRVFVVEHWRIWVFLFLNVFLLAIVASSRRPQQTRLKDVAAAAAVTVNTKDNHQGCCDQVIIGNSNIAVKVVDNDDESESEVGLDQRAEAFIAMFRQHLISDARPDPHHHHRIQHLQLQNSNFVVQT